MTFFYNYYSPAFKAGGPIQSLVNLTNYFKHQYPVRIVCSDKDLDGTKLEVVTDCWNNPDENLFIYYNSKSILHQLRVISQSKNIFFINGLYSFRYNLLPALWRRRRRIISIRGMLHPEALAQKKGKKMAYLFFWKLLGLHNQCEYHATSNIEREHIKRQLGNSARVWVIPNLPNELPYQEMPCKKVGYLSLATIAIIGRMKNHLSILLALQNCTAHIEYDIFGPIKDEGYWNECKALVKTLPDNIKVRYNGSIEPREIAEVLSKCHVYIQPSESENFGHSIYEALSIGRPVITSYNTPWQDLSHSRAGANVEPQDYSKLTKTIESFATMDEQQLQDWSIGAKEYISRALNIEEVKNQYREMFEFNK